MKLAASLDRLGTESAFSVLAEAKKLEAQGNPMIHLGLGQPDFKTPKHVVEAAKKALDDGHHGYVLSNGILECRQAVTRWIKKRYNTEVDPERIIIMPGGKPTMHYAIQCFGEPGAEIIHPTPAFPIYESMINYTGSTAKSVMDYINEQYDPAMNWKDAEYCIKKWNKPMALKGVMSVEDAKRAIDIGCTAIMISNHGGRQLDGSRSPFDQVKAISDAVGDKLEIILDGGVRRGTHVLKALSAGATACSFGKAFLFSLGAGGQKGVERLLENMQKEIRRNMILMGCKSVKDLDETKIIYRN